MTALRVPVTSADHIKGPVNAPVTLVEYGDYECLHCGLAHSITKDVQQYFGRSLKFVFRHFPLSEVHPHAEDAAECAEYAGTQGRFWEMHDCIFDHQDSLSLPRLFTLAESSGVSETGLRNALATRECAPKIRGDFMGGVSSGVNGTPTFFIDDHRHDGPYNFETLTSAIAERLQAKAL